MIIVCQQCTSRFQIDDQKLAGRRTTHCPKCNQEIDAVPASPASAKSGVSLGGSPATDSKRYGQARPAPLFEIESGKGAVQNGSFEAEKLVQMLAALMQKDNQLGANVSDDRPWKQRKVLLCTTEVHRENIARLLAKDGYQVFVALDTEQAVERMRENRLDVVLLDPQFDAVEQGAAFVVREVNVLRPAQRRRLFFVLLSPTLRTLDAHGAFLNNVNAIINLKDSDDLVGILGIALRSYNELYSDFNNALKVAAI
jgi:predicted Zn finger-like uncharacterized protein